MLHRTIVSALIISSDNLVLLGKKAPGRGGVYTDKWHIPGGGVEAGEELVEALQREIKEETGINTKEAKHVELADDLGHATAPKTLATGEVVPCEMDFYVYKVIFAQKAAEITMSAGDDFAELTWVPIKEIHEYPHTPPSISLFLRLGWLTSTQAANQEKNNL